MIHLAAKFLKKSCSVVLYHYSPSGLVGIFTENKTNSAIVDVEKEAFLGKNSESRIGIDKLSHSQTNGLK